MAAQTEFQTDNLALQTRYHAACLGLHRNLVQISAYERPILIEGAEYQGIWLECGPHEGLLYGRFFDPQVAVNCHRIFFRFQQEDGYLPCYIWAHKLGTAHVQSVVPIASTALETFVLTSDNDFLLEAYLACSRYDDWLARYRDTRRTGLCEVFCEWDTGHDASPRVAGLPNECPEGDARQCPDLPDRALPWLAPDLSAMRFGGQQALARMAALLGREAESVRWQAQAEETHCALLAWCFDPESLCFYDMDANNRFIRIKGDVLTRVLSEQVPDTSLFDAIYTRHIRNPEAFWTPYPLPSIAVDDPAFVRDLPHNTWGGASQALTALRAPRWFEPYGKHTDLTHLMQQWVTALVAAAGFRQQLNPFTGELLPASDGYSPAMLVLLDFIERLYGITATENGALQWNCRLPDGATSAYYRRETKGGLAELHVGPGSTSRLTLAARPVATVVGVCRLTTDPQGNPLALIGTEPGEKRSVMVRVSDIEWTVTLAPDASRPCSLPDAR